ncbi:MAG: hypothetical protein IKV92_04495 [Akkermansia sp.]|nr:hypothetical protein [Akkermansia sp.]
MNYYGKGSLILSLASVLAMVCYGLLAWLLFHRYDRLFDAGYTSFDVSLCGKTMQYFIWWGAGLAGWLFIGSADSDSRGHRAWIWSMLQCISAWVLAYPAAFLGRMNDGCGIMLILFAPLATLPSFAAALIIGKMQNSCKSPQSYFRSRLYCFLVILTFVVTTLSSFLCAEIMAHRNPPQLEDSGTGEDSCAQNGTAFSADSNFMLTPHIPQNLGVTTGLCLAGKAQ